jgi:NADH:ubiquinone oxidoreductase subunit E
MVEIRICLGSSCFSRGNADNLRIIQEFLAASGHTARITTMGHLCQDECSSGPNLIVDGVKHHNVSPMRLREILARACGENGAS